MKSLFKLDLDSFGVCISTLCAIHCLITPFIFILFPFAGLAFLVGESFEMGILVLSILFATTSLVTAYFKKHKKVLPMILASVGFVFYTIGKVSTLETVEIILSAIGGGFVIVAYWKNRKLVRPSKVL